MSAVANEVMQDDTLHSEDSHRILSLAVQVTPISETQAISEVADIFLKPEMQKLLSLPVVKDGKPIGIISRYNLMKVFMKMYGRELFGKRPVSKLMNTTPVIVDGKLSVSEASQHITDNMTFPVMDDFVIVDENGYVGVGVVTDVLKKMEHQLARNNAALNQANSEIKASQARLIQSEKMASLGQMVAGVAHEINTPLGYVNNNVQMLGTVLDPATKLASAANSLVQQLMSEEPDEFLVGDHLDALQRVRQEMDVETLDDMRELLQDTLFGIEQISELVMSLKNFARLDQAKTAHINLNECIESALTISRNNLKNKVEVVKCFSELPDISCSPSQLNQVFLNLFNNAAQAIDEAGQLIIETGYDDEHVTVTVTDTGKGMPEEVREKIFDPFFTTKPIGEGTGLGLSITFQIIEQHNGKISVSSVVGEGTTFHISLPREGAVSHD